MDNGEKERAVTNKLKEIVKHTSRRKTATTQSFIQRDPVLKIAPKPASSTESPPAGSDPNHKLSQENGSILSEDKHSVGI
jgi:hypothetical protein